MRPVSPLDRNRVSIFALDQLPLAAQRHLTVFPILRCSILAMLAASSSVGSAAEETASESAGVQITELTNRLRVEINGRLFTEYCFKDVPRPYCYPLIGPVQAPMTRNWPMKNLPDESRDHPHHRSLWFAHGEVNGQDFWSEQKSFGKIVHEKFT